MKIKDSLIKTSIVVDQDYNEIGDVITLYNIAENIETRPSKRNGKSKRTKINKPSTKGKNHPDIIYDNEYVVEKIINKRILNGKTQYRIKWLEYANEHNTWEDKENIFCHEKIQDFEKQLESAKVHDSINIELIEDIKIPDNLSPKTKEQRKTILINWKFKALKIILNRRNLFRLFKEYKSARLLLAKTSVRTSFLKRCIDNNIIPTFLRFKVPTNGKFTEEAVNAFQTRLLKNEFTNANMQLKSLKDMLKDKRNELKIAVNSTGYPNLLAHIARSVRESVEIVLNKINTKHDKKINSWSIEQDRPLGETDGTIKLIGDIEKPPAFVYETLKLGPRNPILSKFDDKDTLCELDMALEFCEK